MKTADFLTLMLEDFDVLVNFVVEAGVGVEYLIDFQEQKVLRKRR